VSVGESIAQLVSFPNLLVFLTARPPTGGTRRSIVNHVGLNYRHSPRRGPSNRHRIGPQVEGNIIAFVLGSDGVKVELIENKTNANEIQLHHIYWAATEGEEMRAWYTEHFSRISGTRIG